MKRILSTLAVSVLLGCASDQHGVPPSRMAIDPSLEDLKVAAGAFRRGDCKLAQSHWQLAADRGHPDGQNGVGVYYQIGCVAAGISIDYKAAATWYKKAAQQGSPVAYSNLGHLYRSGAGVEKSDQQAIAHYHYAARWGYEPAVKALREAYNLSAPAPDLLYAAQLRKAQRDAVAAEAQREKARQEEAASSGLGALLEIVLAGASGYYAGKSGAASAYTVPSALPSTAIAPAPSSIQAATTQQRSFTSPTSTTVSGINTGSTASDSCSSDFSCGVGKACVKPMFQSSGVCLATVDAYGVKQYNGPSSNSIGVRTKEICTVNTDCAVGFRCDAVLKACVR